MNRTRDYYRHHRSRSIDRKQRICRLVYRINNDDFYKNNNQYSKNKIHCSCCGSKTGRDGEPHRDKRKLLELDIGEVS